VSGDTGIDSRPHVLLIAVCLALLSLCVQLNAWAADTRSGNGQAIVHRERLDPVAGIVKDAIRQGEIPGAVVIVGTRQKVVYRRAFGFRSLVPRRLPMKESTIFDIASLTKVVATTTAVMQLMEKGKLRLEDPVARYWPEFSANGKADITVRELLTHYSGLRPDLDPGSSNRGYAGAIEMIAHETPIAPPGTRFIYSDINFEALGELVRRISGEQLDTYCKDHIFGPLGMRDTTFRPPRSWRSRIAPTEWRQGAMLRGEVQDPTARRMGGVAGHAGLFSSAGDLALFARMLLNNGTLKGKHILSALSVEKMTSPQSPPGKTVLRGLGWDIDSPFSSARGELYPVGSYGHTGFTGTSLWIDPVSGTFVIILTNRVHPDGRGDAVPLRSRIATAVASALGPEAQGRILASGAPLTGEAELLKSYAVRGPRNGRVQAGIDVLEAQDFAPLMGLRIGLITNHTGVDSEGRRTVDLLASVPGVKLAAIFSPEHGLYGTQEEVSVTEVTRDKATGLPVYSLYGKDLRPTEEMLDGLDALVFDIQDAGVRFYTYITTMGYAMEEAARKGIAFYVLDRPDLISGAFVQGPVMDDDLKSFTGYFPLPLRHGMTVGELAGMFNKENEMGLQLHVIKMRGYKRPDWYDETGLRWIDPSPNLKTLQEAILYPAVAMAEGANVSVGRGTGTPFELLGAPWIDAQALADYLNARRAFAS
jgi:CubicO group peptidase (beta-lactamase class C family)